MFLFQPSAHGQQLTGSLGGTTYDQSGAVIPNASVELKNQASGDVRKTVSNSTGNFTISAIPSGSYTVVVSSPGFASWEERDIVIGQGDARTLPNISLKMGGTSQQVEVVAGGSPVPVDSGEVSITLNNRMVTELSLVGRDAGELLKIMPGMALNNGLTQGSSFSDQVVGTNSGPVGAFSANGTQPNGALAFMLDGANLVDPGNQGTQIANINQDMTQEVKVLMSSYGAEFAKGPVLFQAISKSGGNAFHGEGYLYARDSVFDSVDAFSKSQGGTNADQHYYYAGGNIGGPILLPFTHFNRNRDKLFFWFGYEYMDQHPAATPQGYFVPTDQMKAGNFSPSYLATIPGNVGNRYSYAVAPPCPPSASNPLVSSTGSCASNNLVFPGGIIPPSLFDPNALALLKLYPEPNADPATHGGNNYEFVNSSPQNRWEQTEKVDYAVNDNTKVTVSFSRQIENDLHPITTWWAPPTALPYPSPMTAATTANVIMANATHVFSPTLTNETVFTWARYVNPLALSNPAAVDPSKIGYNVAGLFGAKETQFPNILSWSGSLAGFYPNSFGGPFMNGDFGGLKSDPAIYDNLSKVLGTHTMKFGVYWDKNHNQQSSGSDLQGTLEFEPWGGTSTGNVIADLLTGRAQSYTQANTIPVQDVQYHQYSLYAQDSWKFNKRLTLNYGIRFDHEGQWYNQKGLLVFDPAKYSNAPDAPVNTGLVSHATDSSIPLSGWKSPLAYPDPRFGVAYDVFGNGKTVLRGGVAVFRYQVGVGTVGGAADAANGSFNYSLNNLTSLASIGTATGLPSASTLNGTTIYTMQKGDNKVPGTTDYNFTISQAVPWRSVMEISYVGNRSFDLLTKGSNSKINDPNAIPVGSFFKPDPKTGVIPCTVGLCNNLNTNDYFPLMNYQDIYEAAHTSYSNYNSLQAAWQKQTGHQSFLVNYTFSKVMGVRDGVSDNGSGAGSMVDPFNLRANYGVLAYDHTHVFNAAYVYNLPSPIHGNAVLKGVVNGWELSGYTSLQSGAPIQPNTGGTLNWQLPNNVSNSSYLGTNAITLVPKITCDPRDNLSSGQYFNTSCFAVPAPGTNGDIIWPYIKGPKYFNSDLSAYKNFKIGEGAKSVQFRLQASNFLNHPNPQFGVNGNGDISLKFASTTATNSNTTTSGSPFYSVGSRLITFAVKFYF